jgi:hypothetical protein
VLSNVILAIFWRRVIYKKTRERRIATATSAIEHLLDIYWMKVVRALEKLGRVVGHVLPERLGGRSIGADDERQRGNGRTDDSSEIRMQNPLRNSMAEDDGVKFKVGSQDTAKGRLEESG